MEEVAPLQAQTRRIIEIKRNGGSLESFEGPEPPVPGRSLT